jgi:hypothetical protein
MTVAAPFDREAPKREHPWEFGHMLGMTIARLLLASSDIPSGEQ